MPATAIKNDVHYSFLVSRTHLWKADCGTQALAKIRAIASDEHQGRPLEMRTILFATVLALVTASAVQSAPLPSCSMQKAREVSFRNATSKDILEISIGTGPCYHATLTIVIRTRDEGQILYSYVQLFGQHVVEPSESKELIASAKFFVDDLLTRGMISTDTLPPWLPTEEYAENHQSTLNVTREVYEDLRKKPRPMFSHPTYHEGWKSVTFDEKASETIEVLSGGV